MLIAVKLNKHNIEMYYWEAGGCATLNSGGWAGWSTPHESSHPSQSENEFIHNCLKNPGKYHIIANENQVRILDMETNNEIPVTLN